MHLNETAKEAAKAILAAFQKPNDLPKPLATIFIHRQDPIPCRNWSWRNQLLVALHDYTDARGFRQWQAAGRQIKKGEKAFYILSPCMKRVEDKETGKEETILCGFRGTAVFGLEQTEGEPLPAPATDDWIESLPLIEVARSWGIRVDTFNAGRGPHGRFARLRDGSGQSITIGVKNLAVWTHELVHAADFRNGNLHEMGQHWRSETVAQLGGAVLLRILGFEHDADLGGCWDYIQNYAAQTGIEVLDACGRVLDRTCEAVALVLDEAEKSHDPLVPDCACAVG
jgi:hypothetical protein